MVTETEMFEFPDLTPLDSSLWDWMKSDVCKIKVDKRVEIPDCILAAAAARINPLTFWRRTFFFKF